MGPHPAVAAIRLAVRESLAGIASPPAPVWVACSGGADSLALAAALAFEAPRAGITAGLVTVDHGLQPGSSEQAERVTAIGRALEFETVRAIRVQVDPTGPGGPEAAARGARYAALDGLLEESGGASWILVGHTLDDQAETVLLGLGRGSGARSIAGMRPVTGRYRRPLLAIRRATTVTACAALGLTPWADPHNDDPRFQRVRLRSEVLPLLEDVLQGGVTDALARTAVMLQADLDALDAVAAAHPRVREWPGSLAVADVDGLLPAIRSRVLRDWAHANGVPPGQLNAGHLASIEALVTGWRGQGPTQLPGGYEAVRVSGTLCLRARTLRLPRG